MVIKNSSSVNGKPQLSPYKEQEFIVEPFSMTGDIDLGCLRFHRATWKQCHEVLCFYRTKKVIDQGKFKIHLWVHQRGSYSKMEEAAL